VSPLGELAVGLGRRLGGGTAHAGDAGVAALQALTSVHGRGVVGRCTLSAISHAFWVAANVGCLIVLLVLLSTKRYVFNWETTILDASSYQSITRVIAAAPAAFGLPTPSREQIAASEGDADAATLGTARVAWSGLLVGSVLLYGLVPRALLLAVCLGARRAALRRWRLDLSAPGYVRLASRLTPDSEERGIIDGDAATAPATTIAPPVAGDDASGPPAIVGIELATPASGPWPPSVAGAEWTDLGFAESREDRQRVAGTLATLAEPPRMTVIVGALTTTPDRGLASFIRTIAECARGPVALALTGGGVLRDRTDATGVAQREEDWHGLATAAGIPPERVASIDLDHLTDASRARLSSLIGVTPGTPAGGHRRIEAAFTRIVDAAAGWDDPPTARQVTELSRGLAELYDAEANTLGERLALTKAALRDPVSAVRAGAAKIDQLLPVDLRRSPRWAAAGALGGVLGCLAVGSLVAPAAFAALPVWTMSGAGLGAVLQLVRGQGSGDASPDDAATPDRSDAVRASVLFALVLDLQGREESAIARVLEATLDENDALDAAADADAISRALDEIRHRYDLALARETRS
ncbi:MAG: DUF2868 domain-containing protein, partial [Phycisphaerales bacterium]|nr:DUF2868 domain-containing protein [Phycisphaerales bacterium]